MNGASKTHPTLADLESHDTFRRMTTPDYQTQPNIPAKQHKALTITGWVLTIILSLLLAFSATMKFVNPPELQKDWGEKLGYPAGALLPIAIAEVACVVLYLIPRTAILGAILVTGYLGGAIATHVRIGEPFILVVIIGMVVWLALFLREPRLRALIPIRRCASQAKSG